MIYGFVPFGLLKKSLLLRRSQAYSPWLSCRPFVDLPFSFRSTIHFGYFWPFASQYKYYNQFVNFLMEKKPIGIFIAIALSLQINLERIDIFTILSLVIHNGGISFYFYVFVWIFSIFCSFLYKALGHLLLDLFLINWCYLKLL